MKRVIQIDLRVCMVFIFQGANIHIKIIMQTFA